MATKDLGKAYFTSIDLPRKMWPPIARARSMQTEPPYRPGSGWAIRVTTLALLAAAAGIYAVMRWPAKALVVGWWGEGLKYDNEDEAFEYALDQASRWVS